jgi:hypothetical protein
MGMLLVEAGYWSIHAPTAPAYAARTFQLWKIEMSARHVCATGSPAPIALARPCADKCWHQLLPWLVSRLREKPLEISHGARLLSRPFRQISHKSVAAIPRTIPLLTEPSVSMGNESNATIAIWI